MMMIGSFWGKRNSAVLGLCVGIGLLTSHDVLAATRSDQLNVVVTIKPVHSLVQQVMEGLGTPALLVDGQASPHTFALRPSDARALSGADVVVRVGPTVEAFTVKLAETLPSKTTLLTLVEAPGVKLLETRRGSRFEAHDHDGADEKHDDAHDHGDKAQHADHSDHDHEASSMDGHIWLDPDNAKAIVRSVAAVLGERRPDLKDKLAANVDKAIADIDSLDVQVRADVAPIVDKPFVVFHDAFQYFEAHYGLHAAGSITLHPEVKPSARRLSEIRETVVQSGAHCVFTEPQFSPRIVASVIEGSDAKAGTLDPLGANIPAGPNHYATLMRSLAVAMVGCLGG